MEFIVNLSAGDEKFIFGALCTLVGVFVAGIINYFIKRLELQHARKIKRMEFSSNFKHENLFKPVVSFIESDLIAMQSVYGLLFSEDKERSEINIKNDHLGMLASIEARVKALTDNDTYEKFNEFTRMRLQIGNSLEDGDKDTYTQLKSAIALASEIINLLYKQASDVEI